MKILISMFTLTLAVFIQSSCSNRVQSRDAVEGKVISNRIATNAVYPPANSNRRNAGEMESNQMQISEFDFIGCWGGTGGGLIEITPNQIRNVHSHESFAYEIVEQKKNEKGIDFLLKLTGNTQSDYIKSYFLVRPLEANRFAYYGYDSFQDYQSNHFSAAAEFFRGECENDK